MEVVTNIKRKYFILTSTFTIIFCLIPYLNVWATPIENLEIASGAAILMDAESGTVLLAKNMNTQMEPASITKILTALLALEHFTKQEKILMSREAVFSIPRGASHIALEVDEEISIDQALYAIMLESANDAANGIAEHIGGSLDNFAVMMNQRANQIGANNTHFTNAHGLHDSNHITTAYDMALIEREALKNPDFLAYSSTATYTMLPTNMQEENRFFHNMHAMIRPRPGYNYPYQGTISGKTGYTAEAGYTLVTAVKRNERTLIAVILKASGGKEAYTDSIKLFDYGFALDQGQFNQLTVLSTTNDKEQINPPVAAASTFMISVFKIAKVSAYGLAGLLAIAFAIRWFNLGRRRLRRNDRIRIPYKFK